MVSFSPNECEITEIGCLCDMTEEAKSKVWFTKRELLENQSLDLREMTEYLRGVTQTDFEMRGLENRGPEASLDRKMQTLDVIQGVLEEQARQTNDGNGIDREKLAALSRELSLQSMYRARELGRSDARYIPEVAAMEDERQRKEREARHLLEAAMRQRESKSDGDSNGDDTEESSLRTGKSSKSRHGDVPSEVFIKSGIRKFLDRARRGQIRMSRS